LLPFSDKKFDFDPFKAVKGGLSIKKEAKGFVRKNVSI